MSQITAEVLSLFLVSVRDAFVQVSSFVAVTVLVFSYLEYRSGGALVDQLETRTRLQPLFGAMMGLTPGCGGAIVMMPLFTRGVVGFGTVVATLVATAGDSAFVVIARAPEAALVAYALAFVAAVVFGYVIEWYGLGIDRVYAAMEQRERSHERHSEGILSNKAHLYDTFDFLVPDRGPRLMRGLSHGVHVLWWLTAAAGLYFGITYLTGGAPEIPVALGLGYAGLFTVVGILGTVLSVFNYMVGRHWIGRGQFSPGAEGSGSTYRSFLHAAMETSFVTLWVVVAYLVYEYGVLFSGVDIAGLAAAAGALAPVAGAAIGLIPGCGPQIVLASAYAEGALPFSTLVANAISQDGDALFPLIAIDKRAALVVTLYTLVPALIVGVAIYLLFGPLFGYGVLG